MRKAHLLNEDGIIRLAILLPDKVCQVRPTKALAIVLQHRIQSVPKILGATLHRQVDLLSAWHQTPPHVALKQRARSTTQLQRTTP